MKKKYVFSAFIVLVSLLTGCGGGGGSSSGGDGGTVYYPDDPIPVVESETEKPVPTDYDSDDPYPTNDPSETEEWDDPYSTDDPSETETEEPVPADDPSETEEWDDPYSTDYDSSETNETIIPSNISDYPDPVPSYENNDPYQIVVRNVYDYPDVCTLDYRYGYNFDSVYGDYDFEKQTVTFRIEAEYPGEELFVDYIGIGDYTLYTDVKVDSDVKGYEFQFDELNNDNESVEGDFILTLTNVNQKPLFSQVRWGTKTSRYDWDWSNFSLLDPIDNTISVIEQGVYNSQDHTYTFKIDYDGPSDVLYIYEIDLFESLPSFYESSNNCEQIYRGVPKNMRYVREVDKGSAADMRVFNVIVTDNYSLLPDGFNFNEKSLEVIYTTSEGEQKSYFNTIVKNFAIDKDEFRFYTTECLDDVVQINKFRIGNFLYEYGFNMINGGRDGNSARSNELILDLSDFRKCPVDYELSVENVPSDMDNILVFSTDTDEKYSVKGNYDSDSNRMVYSFKSPADKILVTYISIGSKKSTIPLNYMTPGVMTVFHLGNGVMLDYNKNMGLYGNKWADAGCPECEVAGSGSEILGDLKLGNGICNICRNIYSLKVKCEYCYKSGKCSACGGEGHLKFPIGINAE